MLLTAWFPLERYWEKQETYAGPEIVQLQPHFVMNPCGRVGDSLHGDILTSDVVPKLEVLYVGVEAIWEKKPVQH